MAKEHQKTQSTKDTATWQLQSRATLLQQDLDILTQPKKQKKTNKQKLKLKQKQKQENELKSNLIKIIEALKEETHEYLKEIQENILK